MKYTSDYLCQRYNQATCPWKLRTDRQHQLNRLLAKLILRKLYQLRLAFHIDENGRAVPEWNISDPWNMRGY